MLEAAEPRDPFVYHKPGPAQVLTMERVRNQAGDLWRLMEDSVPASSGELILARWALLLAVQFFNNAVLLNTRDA